MASQASKSSTDEEEAEDVGGRGAAGDAVYCGGLVRRGRSSAHRDGSTWKGGREGEQGGGRG